MVNPVKLDKLYMDLADRISQESHARRLKVGAVIVSAAGDNILSYGWNGTPAGMDNNCEIENPDGTLTTRPEVLHAESNAITKLAGGIGSSHGATLYTRVAPCFECAKLIKQARISRVVYREMYRLEDGIKLLSTCGIRVEKME